MERFVKAWPAALSAGLTLLAFPPFNLGFLVFVSLVPWLVSLDQKSGKEGFRSGYSFGLVFMGGQFVWLFQFVSRWTESPWMGLIPALFCTLAGALYFGLAGWLVAMAWRRNWPWAIPIVWAGVEVFRSFIPALAFPWGLAHTPLYPYPQLIQLAHFGTAYLVSAMVLLANVTLALWMLKRPHWQVRAYILFLAVLGFASYLRYQTPMEGTGKTILIGQTGVEMAFGDPRTKEERVRAAVEPLIERADQAGGALLVLPEGTATDGGAWPPLLSFSPPQRVPLLMGGQRAGELGMYQSAFAFDGEWRYADKKRLVIFGEYVPFRNQLPFLSGFDLPAGDLIPAETTSAVDVGGIRVGPMLCFEGVFADVGRAQARNGAQLLAIMAIDDWYMGTPAPEQLMAGGVFRAVEAGVPLARSASQGISMAVDARGNILKKAPVGDSRIMEVELVVPDQPDYVPLSWAFVWIAAGSIVLLPIADQMINARIRAGAAEPPQSPS